MFEKKVEVEGKNHILRLIHGDITEENTDAIVNAANSSLVLGSGVAGVIRRKGGPEIQKECDEIGRIPVGSAAITNAGRLPVKKIIHAVGPVYNQHGHDEAIKLLKSAVQSSLNLLVENNLESITFPAISTGVFGFPKREASHAIIEAILEFFQKIDVEIIVQICLYSDSDYKIFESVAKNELNFV